MSFSLLYHPDVVSEYIPRIDKRLKKRLGRAVLERLGEAPESHGRPLRGSLAGFWKLRVGDFRVIFRVVRKEVRIFEIIHRKDVYSDVLARLDWESGKGA